MTGHRIDLPGGGGWTLWKWIGVRGAGFPAKDVLALSSPALLPAVDQLLVAEHAVEVERDRAVVALEAAGATADRALHRAAARALEDLRAGRVPASPRFAPVVEGLRGAMARVAAASDDVQSAHDAERARAAEALRDVARSPLFQEAVIWQNHTAFEDGVEWLLRQPAGASGRLVRQKERLVASYLQRYALKNDTIGFFGPVGWGQIVESGPALMLEVGPTLVNRRKVYFEHWAIDALADVLAADPAVRPWLLPRLVPSMWLEGRRLRDTAEQRGVELGALDAAILAAANGTRTARQIVDELAGDPRLAVGGEGEVLSAMERLAQDGRLLWRIDVPTLAAYPEEWVRKALARVGDAGARVRGTTALDALEAGRAMVARAAGDPPSLQHALRDLGETFERLTGRPPVREKGKVYAGRSLVYEDCRRDLQLRIGSQVLERIGPALALVLQSARWYTHAIAERCRAMFRDVHSSMVGDGGQVELMAFEKRVFDILALPVGGARRRPPALIAEVSDDLTARWQQLLDLAPGSTRVERSTGDVAASCARLFDAPGPGWPTARFHSPDLLIAARSVEEIVQGDYLVVLGELHPGGNTVLSKVAIEQHDDPTALIRAREHDVPPSPMPVPVRRTLGARVMTLSPSPLDYDVEFDDSPSWRDRSRVIAAGRLVVVDCNGHLRVRARDGEHDFDVVEFFQALLRARCSSAFRIAPAWKHAPRIALDGLVLARETWRFERDELPFAGAKTPAARFVDVRRWAQMHGLPRFAFVGVPEETKPWYVDFDSSTYVELLARALRTASALRVTEMLPAIDQTWLVDAAGRAYTSELRTVAVDAVEWRPPTPREPSA